MGLERKIAWASLIGSSALALAMWGIAQTGYVWPQWAIYGAISVGGAGLVVALGLWCHIGWVWIRTKGLQVGPALAIGVCLLALIVSVLWGVRTWAPKGDTNTTPAVALKRLIAYEGISLEFASVPGGIALSGLNLPVRNVGSDTINIHIQSVTVGVNTETPLRLGPFPGTILPQTQLFPYHFKFEAGPLQDASKTVFVAFEVDYDTIPPTGQRRSYKKIAFPLSWPNGHNNAPQTEASIVDQWEQ